MSARWILQFLEGRKFYVKIGKFESRIFESRSGVPAGSIIGPICFLVYIDDVGKNLTHSVPLLLADDIKIAAVIRSHADVHGLQSDINKLLEWCEENKLYFNLEKCAVMTMKRTETFIEATYRLGDFTIRRVNELRDLGILVDSKMTFAGHIEQVTTRARQSMGYIKRISNGQFGTRTLKILYTSYVRSKLEFGSVVWDPHVEVYSEDIESAQKQFVMYALGDSNRVPPYRLPPYDERCAELGLERLSVRRTRTNLMFAYDLFNGRIDDVNLSKRLIPVTKSRYELRVSKVIVEKLYLK